MGSRSNSETTSNDVTQNLADNRVVDGDNAIIGGNITLSNTGEGSGTFNVTTTDFGALDTASEAIDRSFASVDNSIAAVQTIAGDAGAQISQALNKVTDFSTTLTGADSSQTTKYLIVAVALVGIAFAIKGAK